MDLENFHQDKHKRGFTVHHPDRILFSKGAMKVESNKNACLTKMAVVGSFRYVMEVIQRGRTALRPSLFPPLSVVPAVSDCELSEPEYVRSRPQFIVLYPLPAFFFFFFMT